MIRLFSIALVLWFGGLCTEACAAEVPPEVALVKEYYANQDQYFSKQMDSNRVLEKNYPPHILKNNLQDDPLLKLGYLNVKHYAKGDGVTDDTAAVRRALYDAYFFELVAYFPSGTYLISDTVDCRINTNRGNTLKGYFIQGAKAPRPLIKLKDNLSAFADPHSPKSMLQIWIPQHGVDSVRRRHGKKNVAEILDPKGWRYADWRDNARAALMFQAGVSSIDFDLGRNNSGAVGLRVCGAQGNYIENIKVWARDGFAGLRDVSGAGTYTANIHVIGGRYGIYARQIQAGCIAGLILENQKELAVSIAAAARSFPLVGFRIVKDRGPVFKVDSQGGIGASFVGLIDGAIELRHGGPVGVMEALPEPPAGGIDKRPWRTGNAFLKNVYVKGADAIIRGAAGQTVPVKAGAWTHVQLYASCLGPTENLLEGRIVKGPFTEIKAVDSAPTDLAQRHLWGANGFPRFTDKDVVSIKDPAKMGEDAAQGDGATDDTEAFRYAIAHFEKIFIPRGFYRISKTLTLGKHTQLFGTTATQCQLIVDGAKWKTLNGPEPILTTVDDAEATTVAAQFCLRFPVDKEHLFNIVVWRAGRHSVIRGVRARQLGYDISQKFPYSYQGTIVTGNGGGKWYGDDVREYIPKKQYDKQNMPLMPKHRNLLIKNTHEPLAIYTHNPEMPLRGAEANVEIVGSRNVQIYGIKTESHADMKDLYLIRNSANITIAGYSGIRGMPEGSAFVRVIDSRNVLVGAFQRTQKIGELSDIGPNGPWEVLEIVNGRRIGVPANRHVNLYWRGR